MSVRWTEILFATGGLIIWSIPFVAGAWALVTLNRIRITQDAMRLQLDAIERSLGSA